MTPVPPPFAMPGTPVLARLRVAGQEVARYRSGEGLDPRLSPRPYLHPVRTLAGTVVTDALPADHRWHLGAGVAIQDIGGVNVWGGRTYRRDSGYVWRQDHGRIAHVGFRTRSESTLVAGLRWRGPDGRELLRESREMSALPMPLPGVPRDGTAGTDDGSGWLLRLRYSLRNATGSRLALGSPGSNGRPGGGYGGFFWRLPELADTRLRTRDAIGEEQVHGQHAPWLALQGRVIDNDATVTLVFRCGDERTRLDPWFVRMATYPGIGSSLAAETPVVLGPGDVLTRSVDVLVVDGTRTAEALADALDTLPPMHRDLWDEEEDLR